MGTWIEIKLMNRVRVRPIVVPLVGTWIEICPSRMIVRRWIVVPLVGTWIEIFVRKFPGDPG